MLNADGTMGKFSFSKAPNDELQLSAVSLDRRFPPRFLDLLEKARRKKQAILEVREELFGRLFAALLPSLAAAVAAASLSLKRFLFGFRGNSRMGGTRSAA